MKSKSLFEILCSILNKVYKNGGVTDIDTICDDKLFTENGFIYKVKDSVILYLWLLQNPKNLKNISYVEYSKNSDKVTVKRRIDDFKVTNYKK